MGSFIDAIEQYASKTIGQRGEMRADTLLYACKVIDRESIIGENVKIFRSIG
jgi:hypothetical protein